MKTLTFFLAFLLCTACIAYGQWTYTNLSEPKEWMGSASVGNKVYFAGGYNGTEFLDEVQVYDISTGTWDVAGGLFNAREFPGGSVTCGSKIFFGGGFNWVTSFNTVDIYDTQTDEWSVEFLSDDRFSFASVSCGTKVLFAGGVDYPALVYKTIVDIYDIQTGEWTTTNLSIAREGIAASVVGDLALFAGGLTNSGVTDRVDIYNFSTCTWSIATLSQARGMASATTVGSKVIIAGGVTNSLISTDRVDIYDASDGSWTTASLSVARAAHHNAVTVGGKAYFVGGGKFAGAGYNFPSDVIDIYDEASNTWSVMNLQTARVQHSVIAVGDYLVVAGGKNNSGQLSSVEIYRHPTLINVPGDYATIQEAINEASHYDTVLVSGGTYYENINFIGKPILVASKFILQGDTNYINNTIINGSQPANPDIGSVVSMVSGEDTTSVLCGFTITGGTGTSIGIARVGGGIFMQYSGGKLLNNHIEYNVITHDGWTFGGGICAGAPQSPMPWVVLQGNRISHNKAISLNDEGDGGGFDIWYNAIIKDNEISWNEASGPFRGDGGGGRIRGDFGDVHVDIRNNSIIHNKAKSMDAGTDLVISGGLDIFYDVSGIVANNTISFNEIEVAANKYGYGTGVLVELQDFPDPDFVFENNLITDNYFTGGGSCMGGGVCIYTSGGKFQNNVIRNNSATTGGGIAILYNNEENQVTWINNNVTENIADWGGGFYMNEAEVVMINSIVWGNESPNGPSIFITGGKFEVRYSDIEGTEPWPGEGNMNEAPQFMTDGYHLDEPGGLLNAGISSINISGINYECPPYDIDGELRPYSFTQPEMGVDEVLITSLDDPISTKNLPVNVYPNPADQMVTITVKNGTVIKEVTIYNQVGQNVYRGLPDNNTLDVSKFKPGVYLIKVITNQSELKEKLIIE